MLFSGTIWSTRVTRRTDLRKFLTPILPSKKNVDEHETLRHCQDRHIRTASRAKKHTGCHVRLPVLDKSTNTSGASAVEAKGTAPFAVTDVVRSLQCIGHSEVVNKSIGALSVKVQRQKAEGQAEIKSSPEESSPAERENLRRPSFQFGKMIYVHVAMPKMAMQRGSGARRLHEGTRWSMDMWQDFEEYP